MSAILKKVIAGEPPFHITNPQMKRIAHPTPLHGLAFGIGNASREILQRLIDSIHYIDQSPSRTRFGNFL